MTDFVSNTDCKTCGMSLKPKAHHPYAACLMFRLDGATVDANMKGIFEYARSALGNGLTIEETMDDISLTVRKDQES